jgi:hypothetical protein
MKYKVVAIEKLLVKTVYEVEASCPLDAENLCITGQVGYYQHSIEEGDDEWIKTVFVEKI